MKYIDELIKEFREEDVKENVREILEIITIERLLKLSQRWGGGYIYIPTQDCILRKPRNRLIIKNFNGKNYGKLARKYNMSETSIRNIIKKKK